MDASRNWPSWRRREAHRLVTLTGVGGVGKTRLALELAARSADNFPDGVFVIELAAVGDPAAVPEAVAAVLGVTHQPGLNVADSVAGALEGRSRLLVFDNCEHVLDAAADMIESILSHSSTVKVLATSREGLRLADEQLWPVPSLVNTGVDSAAATLFVERAQAVAPTISLSRSKTPARTTARSERRSRGTRRARQRDRAVRVHSPFASAGVPGTPEGTIVHYADYIANDFASILMGVEPVHSAMRMVPKDLIAGVPARSVSVSARPDSR